MWQGMFWRSEYDGRHLFCFQKLMREKCYVRKASAEGFWFYPHVLFLQQRERIGNGCKVVAQMTCTSCGCTLRAIPDSKLYLKRSWKKYNPSSDAAPPCHFAIFFLPESDIADFDGRSSLLYRFNQKLMSTFKDVVSLKFKSMQGDGVLFHGEGQRGDYITLELQKGKLSLHLNLGKGN